MGNKPEVSEEAMIGFLRGRILDRTLTELWLEVNGVGYRVLVGNHLQSSLSVDQEVELYIHTSVREDAITLFGFENRAQLQLFELITSVSGIGPKIGLAIVGSASAEAISQAIRTADVDFFTKIKGIGRKGAQRIIVDLKNKLGSLSELDLSQEVETNDEVVEALVSLGFARKDVLAIVGSLEGEGVEERIREGLKRLGRR